VPTIFYNYRIIFLLKISWNRFTVSWTGTMAAHGRGPWVHLTLVVGLMIYDSD
jgi:hypothetical protein